MLTEQQIRDMEPGRELDRLVEWIVKSKEELEKLEGMTWYGPNGVIERPYPPYSSDISKAWEAQKIAISKFRLQYLKALDVVVNEDASVTEWAPDGIINLVKASAADRCKAALIAHMRGGEQGGCV